MSIPIHQPIISDGREVLDSLKDKLKRMKLRVPERPRTDDGKLIDPRIPADITLLNDEQLGRLHGEFAAMSAYVYGQLGLRSVEHSIQKRIDKVTRAKVRLLKSGTVDDKAAKTEVDSRVKSSGEKLIVAEGAEVLTQAIMDSYLVGRDLCSREMTRRINSYSQNSGR
jgi:hypothetical protein